VKLYDSIGPNPRLVRMFLAEKGIEVPMVQVDLMAGENRRDEYKKLNPTGQLPCLELDDGSFLAETVPICEYLEDIHPKPVLIGADAGERAETRMWTRRVELHVTAPMADGFRFSEGLPLFRERIHTIPQAADDLKAIARKGLAWIDAHLASRDYICGERYSLADVLLFAFVEFGKQVGQPADPALENVARWFAAVAERPATQQTVHRPNA